MSISVTFSGQSFTIPSQAERNWATTLNAYLVALSANALPRSGGSFTLAADLDLGATANLYVKGLISKSAGPSTTGYVRLANNEGLGWRNAAGTSDLILKVNASNQLEYNGAPLASGATAVTLTGAQTVQDKTFTNVASMTFAAGGSLDWASGSMSIGATVGPNTMTLGGAATSVYVAGFLKSKILTTDDDKIYINNDAASTGADWKAILQRPVAGMAADATYTFPTISTILVGRDTTDTLSNKILSAPTITSPSITNPSITTAASLTGVATPSTPSAGVVKVYAKTDNKVYKLTSAGLETEIGSGGGLSGVVKTSNYTPAVNEMVEGDATGGAFTVTLPTIPASGGVIGVMDAAENASATNYIRVSPATGQSIGTLPVNDSYLIDYPRGAMILYAAPGATSWKVQYQSTSMVPAATDSLAGTIPRYSSLLKAATLAGATTTPTINVRQVRVGDMVTLTASPVYPVTKNGSAGFLSFSIDSAYFPTANVQFIGNVYLNNVATAVLVVINTSGSVNITGTLTGNNIAASTTNCGWDVDLSFTYAIR